jgi:lupus La protein
MYLKTVEFYFADSNLPYDRFMWTLHSANAEHWVPIATVASFKRMRQFQSKGVPWLADVLRRSESLLEVDETGVKVRRREEVREPKDQFERSVYAVCLSWYL